jgi:hypothetical protein
LLKITAPPSQDRIMSPSVRMIVELNIRHYRDLLESEQDPSKRRVISQLLVEEEEKLTALAKAAGDDRSVK